MLSTLSTLASSFAYNLPTGGMPTGPFTATAITGLPNTTSTTKVYYSACSSNGVYVYYATTSGLYYSSDSGNTWNTRTVNSSNAIACVDCNATGQIVWACVTNSGVFRSNDYGANWTTIQTRTPTSDFKRISCDNTGTYAMWCIGDATSLGASSGAGIFYFNGTQVNTQSSVTRNWNNCSLTKNGTNYGIFSSSRKNDSSDSALMNSHWSQYTIASGALGNTLLLNNPYQFFAYSSSEDTNNVYITLRQTTTTNSSFVIRNQDDTLVALTGLNNITLSGGYTSITTQPGTGFVLACGMQSNALVATYSWNNGSTFSALQTLQSGLGAPGFIRCCSCALTSTRIVVYVCTESVVSGSASQYKIVLNKP